MGKRTMVLACAAVLLMVTGVAAFAQNAGTIREMSGTVELKHSGTADYVAAKQGDNVRADTIISTGFKSTALVELGSAQILVRPLTRLTLKEIQAAPGGETINASLQTGRVRVDLNPPAGTRASMSVSSPSATASVRGTSFDFDTRNLRVREGTVGFTGSRGQLTLVGAGSDSTVVYNGKAADPMERKTASLRPPAAVGNDSSSVGVPSNTRMDELPSSIGIGVTYK